MVIGIHTYVPVLHSLEAYCYVGSKIISQFKLLPDRYGTIN
jgi:hypothetical protein